MSSVDVDLNELIIPLPTYLFLFCGHFWGSFFGSSICIGIGIGIRGLLAETFCGVQQVSHNILCNLRLVGLQRVIADCRICVHGNPTLAVCETEDVKAFCLDALSRIHGSKNGGQTPLYRGNGEV